MEFGQVPVVRVRRSAQHWTSGWRWRRNWRTGQSMALPRKSRALMQEARIDSPLRRYGGGATMPLLAATSFGSADRVGAIVKANEIV